jgi:hypothetical protein
MFVYKLLTRSFKDMERVANETKRTVLFNVTFGQKLILSSNERSKKCAQICGPVVLIGVLPSDT